MDMTSGKKGFGREKRQLSKPRRRWANSIEMVGKGMEQ